MAKAATGRVARAAGVDETRSREASGTEPAPLTVMARSEKASAANFMMVRMVIVRASRVVRLRAGESVVGGGRWVGGAPGRRAARREATHASS